MRNPRIHLIRHGITQANLDGKFVGSTDVPLCQQGIDALNNLMKNSDYPTANLVYVTPLSRTKQTADILYPDLEQVVIEDFKEQDFGDFEGKTAEQLEGDPSFDEWMKNGTVTPPPNGEDPREFAKRIFAGFDYVVNDILDRELGDVAIVAHGVSIMTILALFSGDDSGNIFKWICDNGRGYTVILNPDFWETGKFVEVYDKIPYGADEPQDSYREMYGLNAD